MFPAVVYGFGAVSVILAVFGCVCLWLKNRTGERIIKSAGCRRTTGEKIAWFIFALFVMIQLAGSVFLTYGDGDDAFYVAVSTITEASDTMYKIMPYSIGGTGLDIRHGLAPFPIWIAFLDLKPILTQMEELADLTEHYYDKGYWRDEKYTV